MRKITLLFTFISIFLLVSCSKDEENRNRGVLIVSSEKLFFPAIGGAGNIEIQASHEWQASIANTDTSWCKINKERGTSNEMLEITVLENQDTISRSTQIVIKNYFETKTVIVRQRPLKVEVNPEPTQDIIPLMIINTENSQPIVDKTNYIKGDITIGEKDDNGNIINILFETKMTQDGIRGRGNSTWEMNKKPYKIKLDKSTEVLGMPRNKHWVLLANYADKSLMRNDLAFEISRRMEYPYTPRQKYVDVVLNGNYIGNYMLCEQIRPDDNRVDIPDLNADSRNITGGYLLEIDERVSNIEECVYFSTKGKNMNGEGALTISIKKPEKKDITSEQKQYIIDHIQKIEDALYGRDGDPLVELPKYLDMKTFIDYFLINEISKNVDGNLRLSTYMYKDKDDDRLYFGPVWDYDFAFGNVNYDNCFNTSDWHSIEAKWYKEFFSITEFKEMTKERWRELRSDKLSDMSLFAYIDQIAEDINVSQQNNFACWQILDIYVWPNYKIPGSYEGEIAYLKEFVSERAAWMDSQLQ